MKKHTRYLIILMIVSTPLWAINKVGTAAAQFLKIGTSARSFGLGEAVVADAQGIDALHYNSAALAHFNTQEFMFSQSQWLAGTDYMYVGGSVDLQSAGVVALYMTNLNYGDMLVRTELAPEGNGEKFSAQDVSIGVSYAKRLTDRFSMGTNIKYVSQSIWHMNASTFALDIGALFDLPIPRTRLGMNISNFGGKMQMAGRDVRFFNDPEKTFYGNNDQIPADYELGRWPLPITYSMGISSRLIEQPYFSWKVNVDALHPGDNLEYMNVGSEVTIARTISLRGGYRTLFLTDKEGGLSLGAGLFYAFAPNFKIKADFSWVDYGRLNDVKMLSFSVKY